jgi:acyl-coenzyme A synthetase/AMP-(fatty) acid ligase
MPVFAEHGVHVDAVITEDPKLVWGGKILRLSPQWFRVEAKKKSTPAAQDYSLIFSSSGSTGKPKLVKFSKRNIEYRIGVRMEDEYFSAVPRYYSALGATTSTTIVDYLMTIVKGGVIVHSTDRSPQGNLDTINLFQPNYVGMPPSRLVHLLRTLAEEPRRFDRFDYLRLAGAYCSVATREEALRVLAKDVLISFGATEIGRAAWGKLSEIGHVEGSVGRIIPGVEIETVDDAGEPLPVGSEGELRIRPPKPAVTSYPTPEGERSPLRGGWFYPGDLGRVSPEGHLIVTGRKSLVINSGGNKISPEVAESMIQRIEGVQDVGVLAVKDPNGFDVIGALIVQRDGGVSLESVNQFIRSNKENFVVSRMKFVTAIPRSESGKIDRVKLRELAD